MTGRQRILTALSHRQPDRVPFSWGFGPTSEMRKVLDDHLRARGVGLESLIALTNDKLALHPRYGGPELHGPEYVALWGIGTQSTSYGSGHYEEFVGHPLAGLERPGDLDRHQWPTTALYDYSSLKHEVARRDPRREKAIQVSGGNPFELYTWMTGMEEAITNLVLNPELVNAAMTRICDFWCEHLRMIAREIGPCVDLVFLADDLGSQTGLLISRELYRRTIQPHHKRLARAARELIPQAKILYHSDGAVFDILPDLIESGIDCLEAVQVDAAGMDPARLKAAYGRRLAFHGGISVQQLLPHGDPRHVLAETRRIVSIMNAGGGYIAAPTHAIQVGTPPQNVMAMLEAVLGEEQFAAACRAARLP